MADNLKLVFSVPTSGAGATPAATYSFYTSGYRPPAQLRSTSRDVVHNQNGIFIYRYDNGPSLYEWQPFEIILINSFMDLGPASTQWERLQFLWQYRSGAMGLQAPEDIYSVGWSEAPLERQFVRFPATPYDSPYEMRVVVDLEEF